MSPTGPPPAEAIQQYRELMQNAQRMAAKIAELETDRNEHRLVEDTLRPLDADRRAYRLVGSVLVERNVGEVLPSVAMNRENLEKSIVTLRERLEESQKKAAELKVKYNLQVE